MSQYLSKFVFKIPNNGIEGMYLTLQGNQTSCLMYKSISSNTRTILFIIKILLSKSIEVQIS